MGEPMVEARGLLVKRGDNVVVDDLSFTLEAGSMLAVLGPNGAGKSTLLKAIVGLVPHGGTLAVSGADVALMTRRERARRIAYVPQHSALEAPLPAREVIAQGRFARAGLLGKPTADDERAVARAIELTDVGALVDRAFSRLSYGERRLVLLARALATEATILALDEPTAALDVAHALRLLRVLRRLADDGAAVMVVLHPLHEAVSACDRALLMARGRCVAHGPTAEVIAPGPVRQVYGVEMVPGGQFGYRLESP